jgi:predicted dehydrogenase
VTAAAVLDEETPAPARSAGPRVVVIAAGSHIFQAAHVPAIRATGVEVVGVFDADTSRAAEVAVERGWRVAETLDELLALDAEAAVICAPHPLHARLVERCLSAGLWVLVEKPLAARLSEIDALIAAAETTGRQVAVVQQHRLRAEVVDARRRIGAGELGAIHRAVVTASYPKRASYYVDTPWRGTWEGEGGGVLLNQGLHDIDVLVHLLGRPDAVTASLRTLVQPIETEDTADVLLEWADGATATVHVTSAARLDGNRIEIFGSRGSLRLSQNGLETRSADLDFGDFAATPGGHFDAYEVSDWRRVLSHGGGTHTEVYSDFAQAWRDRSAPLTTARGARDAVEVIAAAALSSTRRATAVLPVDPTEFDAFLDARIATSPGRRTPERTPA